jgi:putative ABC transport system permease protein
MSGVMGWFYRRFPALLMARRNLMRTKIRTLLAALGIVIGVIAIASLGIFGVTLKYQITQNIGDIGNEVIVRPSFEGDFEPFSEREIREISGIAPADATVVSIKSVRTRVTLQRGETQTEQVEAMRRPSLLYDAKEGTIPDPLRSGAVVGTDVARENDLQPGDTISINGSNVRVRAVLAQQQGLLGGGDDAIIVSEDRYKSVGYTQVRIVTESGPEANQTAVALREQMNDRRNRVQVTDLSQIANNIGQVFTALNLFLTGIGSISLLVAGVSILNVMLMSTVERKEEIGVLRAVGFQRLDVLKIMLAEATLLGVLGGVIGVVFSLVAGGVINFYLVDDALLVLRGENFLYIGLAFTFGVGTALVSGFYPAWKAANERPVEALRS